MEAALQLELHEAVTDKQMICYQVPRAATSTGVWLGDNPLHFSLPLLIFQITMVFISTRLTHAVLRHLGQPLVISQIIGGVLLGPSFLCRNEAMRQLLFGVKNWEQLNILSLLSLMLFLFMIGVKTDMGMIRRSGKKAFAIAIIGSILPFTVVVLIGRAIHVPRPRHYDRQFLLFSVASRWSLTSYTVLSCVLAELNLLTSKLGRLAMSASLISDFFSQFMSAVVTSSFLGAKLGRPELGIASFAAFLCFVAFLLLVARPLVLWMVRRTPEGSLLDEAYFVGVILLAIISGLISEVIGYNAAAGPFLLGLILPGGPPLGVTVVERLDRLVNGVFLPLFLASTGARIDLSYVTQITEWGLAELFLLICTAGKFLGVMLPCLYCKMPLRDAIALGLMMNSRGIYEVDSANQWLETKIINRELHSIVILTVVIIGGGTAPLVKFLYRPEDWFVSYKRRTVQHIKPDEEFRLLACVHNEENVGTVLAFLEGCDATREKPVCLYILHLIELAGRTAAVLAPHKKHKKSFSGATETDHIVNAFRRVEEQSPDCVSILPYVCLSPYVTMHDDICSLALDKKVYLIILHFHKHMAVDGTIEAVNPAIQAMNVNVLRYAPCSVAILIDHGLRAGALPEGLLQHVAVYFLGGPDDREALACGQRFAQQPRVGVTVVRFRLHNDWKKDGGREEKHDDEAVNNYRTNYTDGRRVVYREEVVRDGEGTVGVIRSMSEQFSLLIVGRREGKESPLTEGLGVWSEYPELGVIGDMLASTDFGGRVSTMVVQQQRRLGGGAGRAESPRGFRQLNQVIPCDDED